MQLESPEGLEQFRQRVRAFIADNAPIKPFAGLRAPEPEDIDRIRRWTAALFDEGYLGMEWPVEYGGRPDAHPLEPFVVREEIARARAWLPIGAWSLAASALIEFGTAEQRARYLPGIRCGTDIWCQLFSEPGAGSDLASLQTRATLTGEHYVVDGQKVWTTNGQNADLGYLLARTDSASKQGGITAFILDMRTPGIEVRPLREITGSADFNEVFLDQVHIPRENVLGEINQGWRVATSSLARERHSSADYSDELYTMLDGLVDLARSSTQGGGLLADDSAFRLELGRFTARAHVNGLLMKLTQSRTAAGTDGVADAPMCKVFFSELNLELVNYGLRLLGERSIISHPDARAHAGGWWQDAFLYARAYTIAAGSNEVLRNLIAERGLGLPREPQG